MLRIAPGVRVKQPPPPLLDVMFAASKWSLVAGLDVELAAVEGIAPLGDAAAAPAPVLGAWLSPLFYPPIDRLALAEWLWRQLPSDWTVRFVGDYVHAEYRAGRPLAPPGVVV